MVNNYNNHTTPGDPAPLVVRLLKIIPSILVGSPPPSTSGSICVKINMICQNNKDMLK